MHGQSLSKTEDALVLVGRFLEEQRYTFTTATPLTHARVNARPENGNAQGLRDIFGWSRPFEPHLLPRDVLGHLEDAGQLEQAEFGLLKSRVRFSSLQPFLVAHSAYPTDAVGSVFFGPDTYRFVAWLRRAIRPAVRGVEVGCGTGVAALALADRVARLTLSDVSPEALSLARVNAKLASVPQVDFVRSDVLAEVKGEFDLVVANPPYLVDEEERTYRHGGGRLGTGLAVRMVDESLSRLSPGGTLALYTGTPVVQGVDVFRTELARVLDGRVAELRYEELDPDVFGEELEREPYREVERLAVVTLLATRSSE